MNLDHLMFHRVIPTSVLGVVALGFLQSLWLILYKPWSHTRKGAWAAKAYQVSGSAAGGLCRNYLLLIVFFGLATLYSVLDIQRQKADKKRKRPVDEQPVNALGYSIVVLYHINLTTVLIVDTLTWGLLWPMLKQNPDADKLAFFTNQLFNFTSYNQHGLNLVWMVGELFLNRIPFYPYLLGYVGAWTSLYGVWAFSYFSSSGKWMYPFLDATKPWAPIAYFGLFLVHWVFFGLVILLLRLKYWLWEQLPSSRDQIDIQMAKVQ